MPHSNIAPITRRRAKALRRDLTKAEKIMWSLLKDFNAQGASFRREAPIGPYIADFAWLSKRIVIEVDGDTHETKAGRKHDVFRDQFMKVEGFEVMRFENSQVIDNSEYVFLEIQQRLAQFWKSNGSATPSAP